MLSKKGLGFWCLVLRRKFFEEKNIVENKAVLLLEKGLLYQGMFVKHCNL